MKFYLFIFVFLTWITQIACADEISTTVDRHKASMGYRIGNGVTFSKRLADDSLEVEFPKVKWNAGATCTGWDAGLSVSNILDDIDGQFQDIQVSVVNSITGFVTSLPMLMIQRQDPGLYEMISSTVIDGEDLFNLKIQSCEAMSERFSKGNGFGELADESFWYEFSSAFDSSTKDDTDVVEVMEDADNNKGELGVKRLGGEENCAGADQPACDPIGDAIKEGVNKLFNDSFGIDSGTGSGSATGSSATLQSWVTLIWDDADAASEWIEMVIGTVQYATCEACDQMEHTAGIGVYSDIASEATSVYSQLSLLVDSSTSPTKDELTAISSNDVFIDNSVIEALRAERGARSMFMRQISEEVGLLRVVDKLLAARRILLVGSADPYFQSVSMNKDILNEKLSMISDEVSLLSEELKLKKLARGDAIDTLLSRFESRRRIGENKNTWSDKEIKAMKEIIDRVN